jgi:hypothetical protein
VAIHDASKIANKKGKLTVSLFLDMEEITEYHGRGKIEGGCSLGSLKRSFKPTISVLNNLEKHNLEANIDEVWGFFMRALPPRIYSPPSSFQLLIGNWANNSEKTD